MGMYEKTAGKRGIKRLAAPRWLLPISFFLVELFAFFFLSWKPGEFSAEQLWPLAFGALWAVILSSVVWALPTKAGRIVYGLLYGIITVYAIRTSRSAPSTFYSIAACSAAAMLLFSINFNLYFLILVGRVRAALRSEELWWFLGIVLFSAVTVAFNVRSRYEGMNVSFRYALFQVATIISTTGFATANFNLWPGYSKWLLVTLMLTGGCAGSTCGGIKLSRLLIMGKAALGELRGLLQPRSVSRVRLDGRVIDSRTVSCSFVFFFIYMALIFIGTLLVSLDGYDAVTSLTSVVTCLSNVGPGLSLVGPVGTFDIYSWPVKLFLSLQMLLGRLEIFPVVLLFAPPARALRRRGH